MTSETFGRRAVFLFLCDSYPCRGCCFSSCRISSFASNSLKSNNPTGRQTCNNCLIEKENSYYQQKKKKKQLISLQPFQVCLVFWSPVIFRWVFQTDVYISTIPICVLSSGLTGFSCCDELDSVQRIPSRGQKCSLLPKKRDDFTRRKKKRDTESIIRVPTYPSYLCKPDDSGSWIRFGQISTRVELIMSVPGGVDLFLS